MSPLRQKDQLDTVIRWIDATVAAVPKGHGVFPEQATTWRDALVMLRDDIAAREKAIITAEALIADAGMDELSNRLILDAADTAFGVSSASALVAGLAQLAVKAAPEDAQDIDRMACAIVGTIETLGRGARHPQTSPNPMKGA